MPDVGRRRGSAPGAGLSAVEVIPRDDAMSGSTRPSCATIRRLPGRLGQRADGLVHRHVAQACSATCRYALALLVAAKWSLLFFVTRSFVLPVKAVVMNVLGLLAAFGILVFVFQDGRLEGLLGYQSQGALELTQPVLLAAIAFGLATDYGVFLLSRIREAHDDGLGNREAVALGLERTGRVITAAALLFCVAVGAFATSDVLIVKEVGLGIALAVAIDASLVRALLVPSLMALLGDWNWWAPRRLPALRSDAMEQHPYVGQGAARAGPRRLPTASRCERLFRLWRSAAHGRVRRKANRGAVAARLGGRAGLPRRRSRTRASDCFYQLEMLPYPSGHLHMGHVLNYTMGDVVTHFRRRTAPRCCARWAWTRSGCRPRTRRSRRAATRSRSPSATSRRSRARCAAWAGRSTGSARCPRTSRRYYHWTQWLFLKFLEHGLAYRKEAPVNWCPLDQTVLANEHVVDGRCWRCGNVVEARNMAQWFFKITAYADQLLADLDDDRLAGAHEEDPDELDRPLGGRGAAVPRATSSTSTSPSSRPVPTRCSARRSSWSRPESPLVEQLVEGTDARRRRCSPTRGSPRRARPRSASSARRPASSPAATPSTRRPASRSRSGSPTTC